MLSLRDAEAMYQTFANERLPPEAGGALAVQCQKFLGVGMFRGMKVNGDSRDPQGHGTPPYGKRDPYYFHTTPIRIPKDMGIIWVPLTIRGSHVLGGPWNHHG